MKKSKPVSRKSNPLVNVLRWTARILSAFLTVLILMFLFGEGLPEISKFTMRETIMFASFLLMLAGLISAWWKEGIGGILIFCGLIVFWAVNFVTTKNIWLGPYFLLFPVIGGLFIYCWRAGKAK